ncbi:MAG TPA: hypothetical protein VG916_01855 [Gemmatimonadaceae bacterium]|nr:hypothetical protein [Gemmatimonadaceae bacterium]
MTARSRIRTLVVTAALPWLAAVPPLGAQDTTAAAPRWEVLVSSGRFVPAGALRESLDAGDHTGAQIAYVARPGLALNATLGWTRTHDLASADAARLSVVMLDVGAELRTARWLRADGVTVSPFAGAGVGARRFVGNTVEAGARYNPAAYVGAGGEIGTRRVRVRLEAREYLSSFRALDGRGAPGAGNDLVVMAGLRMVRR